MDKKLTVSIYVIELFIFIVVAWRFVGIKTDVVPLVQDTSSVLKALSDVSFYQIESDPKGKLREAVHQKLESLLGTWTTTCKIPARPGYQAVNWSISALHKIEPDEVQADFSGKREPCPENSISYKRGSVGQVQALQDQWDNVEYWLLIPGVVLFILKLLDLRSPKVAPIKQYKLDKQKKKKAKEKEKEKKV